MFSLLLITAMANDSAGVSLLVDTVKHYSLPRTYLMMSLAKGETSYCMTRRPYCKHTHILVRRQETLFAAVGLRTVVFVFFLADCAAAALFSPFVYIMHLTRLLVSLAHYPIIAVCL